MNDTTKPGDEDFLDDDFDLEDTEGETDGDFDEAEWEEEFSDEDSAQEAGNEAAQPVAKKRVKSPKVKGDKSFFSRYFNVIVILIAVVLGGGFFLYKMSGTPPGADQAAAPAEQPAATDLTNNDNANPIAPDQSADLSMEAPSPTPAGNVEDEFPADTSKIKDVEGKMAASINEAPPMPAPINSVPEDLDVKKPEQPAEKPAAPTQGTIEQEPLTPEPTPVAAAPVAVEAPAAPAPVPVVAPAPMTAPAAITPVATGVSAEELASVNARIVAQEKTIQVLDKRLSVLEKNINGFGLKIGDVSTALAALNAKMDSVQKAVKAPRVTPKTVELKAIEPAPAATPKAKAPIPSLIPETAPVAVAPHPAAAPVMPKAATNSAHWELRFAQPGKAMLAEKGSSDFRTVEVGDSLPGLGKITNIGQESGRWVVRGTQGFVSQ